MENNPRLFGQKRKQDWIDLRIKILLNSNEQQNWKDAVELLELRLNTRYFCPIKKILELRNTHGEGFAVMTLICSLVEFLHSCYEGKMFDVQKKTSIPDFYFGHSKSKEKFTEFLKLHDPFKAKFIKTHDSNGNPITDSEGSQIIDSQGNPITFADDFYSNVRCALLHSAETKNGWKINTYTKDFMPSSFVNLDDVSEKIIYHDKFFEELQKYCVEYQQKIIDDVKDDNGNSLRNSFCRKLDDLCGIYESDKSWWQ